MKKVMLRTVGLLLMIFSANSYAITECASTISRIYTGDDGHVWMIFDAGLVAYVTPSDPDTKNILAIATTAIVTNKTLVIRVLADGALCTSGIRGDVVGLWLLK